MKQQLTSTTQPLTCAKLRCDYKVIKITADTKIKRRLLDFGFVDTCVRVLNRSSLKGVYLLQVRGYVLALRESEVKCIEVVKV